MNILIIGGSDAGVSAALTCKNIDPKVNVKILLADSFLSTSVCGLPYAIKGTVQDERLVHYTDIDLKRKGIEVYKNTVVREIDAENHLVKTNSQFFEYDKLIVSTGAVANDLGNISAKNIFKLHSMQDYLDIKKYFKTNGKIKKVAVIGAGYIGTELTEGLLTQGKDVTLFQRGKEILSNFDEEFSSLVHDKMVSLGTKVITNTTIDALISIDAEHTQISWKGNSQIFDAIFIVIGVKANSLLLEKAGAEIGISNAVKVNDFMETTLSDVYAAGDVAMTKHQLLGYKYLPLGTTAHKQGRIAAINAIGLKQSFNGIIGTQIVKFQNLVLARTGLSIRDDDNLNEVMSTVYDKNSYYPDAEKIKIKIVFDKQNQIKGAQIVGDVSSQIGKRLDILAMAIQKHMTLNEILDLDLSYTPPISSPWDPIQQAVKKAQGY